MKKILSILVFALLCSLVAFCFTACGETEIVEKFTYSLNKDGNSYCLTSYNGSDSFIEIEKTHNNKPVTKIGNSVFENRGKIEIIKIPESVTSIGNYAFSGCSKLKTITFGQGVKEINVGAFYKCNSLTLVEIPDSVETVGDFAFYSCANLNDITIGNSVKEIGQYAFAESGYSLVKSDYSFVKENVSQVVKIGDKVENIGYRAFNNCKALSFVGDALSNNILGKNVKEIASRAFENCVNLTGVTFPDSVKIIGDNAFSGCVAIKNVVMSDNIKRVGANAFEGCNELYNENNQNHYNLYEVEGNGTGVYLGSEVNPYCVLINFKTPDLDATKTYWPITLHKDTQVIADAAFYNCATLNSVTLYNNLKHIGKNAFYGCTKLTAITFYGTEEEWNGIDKFEDETDAWDKNSKIKSVIYKVDEENEEVLGENA